MQNSKRLLLTALALASVLLFGAQSALAIGTASNVDITNTATLEYEVDGTAQVDIVSNETTFKVDKLVNLTVVAQSGNTSVVPNQDDATVVFTLTNTGNDVQDFLISIEQGVDGSDDDFDVSGYELYLDMNGNSTYESGTDAALATSGSDRYIDELSAASGSNAVTILVVSTIPGDAVDDETSDIILQATARAGEGASALGAALSQTSGADTATAVDTVFGDTAGDYTDDVNRDADHSDTATYLVATADISVVKTHEVIRDPFNLGTNPKRIPGAYVRYTLTITNDSAATASAILTEITDVLNANTTLDPNFIDGTTGTATDSNGNAFRARARGGAWTYFTGAADSDGIDHAAGTITVDFQDEDMVLPTDAGYDLGELAPNETVEVQFNVTIN